MGKRGRRQKGSERGNVSEVRDRLIKRRREGFVLFRSEQRG